MKRVLFVDDDPSVLDGLERIMGFHADYEIATARGGEEALAVLAAQPFDVIVTDMRMPGMNGAMLLERVLAEHPSVIRIVLSGHSELQVAMRTIPIAQQFLAKPCEAAELHRTIERACALRSLLGTPALRAAVGRIRSLPPRPHVYAALIAAIGRSETTVDDVAEIVERDPAVAARVLQIVNSAFLGLSHPTASVAQAIGFIGFSMLPNFVLSCEIFGMRGGADGRGGATDERHAFLTASLARRIADKHHDREHAFMAGLLHETGRIVLGMSFPDECREIEAVSAREGRPIHELERERLGVGHAEVGAYLLGLWGLPLPIVEAVAWHREPWRLAGAANDLPCLIHTCCRIATERSRHPLLPAEAVAAASDPELRAMGAEPHLERWRERAADAEAA